MSADLEEKTDRYESLLAEALDAAEIVPPDGTPLQRLREQRLVAVGLLLKVGGHAAPFEGDDKVSRGRSVVRSIPK